MSVFSNIAIDLLFNFYTVVLGVGATTNNSKAIDFLIEPLNLMMQVYPTSHDQRCITWIIFNLEKIFFKYAFQIKIVQDLFCYILGKNWAHYFATKISYWKVTFFKCSMKLKKEFYSYPALLFWFFYNSLSVTVSKGKKFQQINLANCRSMSND